MKMCLQDGKDDDVTPDQGVEPEDWGSFGELLVVVYTLCFFLLASTELRESSLDTFVDYISIFFYMISNFHFFVLVEVNLD